MHRSLLFTILTSIISSVAQASWLGDIVTVPTCARQCAGTLPAGCSTDPTCVCKNAVWMNDVQCCIQSRCSATDVLITQQFASQLCKYVGQPPKAPSCPKPTTLVAAAPTVAAAAPGTYPAKLGSYNYKGCFRPDPVNNHVIWGVSYIDKTKLTQDVCLGLCAPKKYRYAGLVNGDKCFCGNENLEVKAIKQPVDYYCTTRKCPGNAKQLCGGDNFMAVWGP